MSYQISVKPSDHTFEAEPRESLLHAGLQVGLNLNHGCDNGSCGDCRARLLSGEIAPLKHTDFRFSEQERQQGWFLMCSCAARSDLCVQAHETGTAAEISEQRIRAKVTRLERLQDEVMQLTLRTPRSGGLHFLAGQSVALLFDGMRPRTLSIASCPCDGIQLRFHVRYTKDDHFSEFVFERLRKGRDVILQGPLGDFTLDEESMRPMILVAWESGFAAISSLIDHAIQKDENRSIDLYWLSAIARGHYLSNYCRAWVDALDDFRYHSIDLVPAGHDRIEHVIQRILSERRPVVELDFYLALPEAALYPVSCLLQEAGVPASQIRCSAVMHA